jgi:hypothetical protein
MKKPVAAIHDANASLEVVTFFPFYFLFFSVAQFHALQIHEEGVEAELQCNK